MIKIILAYDEDNYTLGEYFAYCAFNISQYFNDEQHGIIKITGRVLNSAYIDLELSKHENIPFLFIAYSHGTKHSLISDEEYLSNSSNLLPFQDSFFYTFSCSSGIELGMNLIDNGAKVFIGYKSDVYIITTYQQIFAECANEGMKYFLKGESVENSFLKMIEKHNDEIDNIYSKNFFVASTIRQNRDSLILKGKQAHWTVNDFLFVANS